MYRCQQFCQNRKFPVWKKSKEWRKGFCLLLGAFGYSFIKHGVTAGHVGRQISTFTPVDSIGPLSTGAAGDVKTWLRNVFYDLAPRWTWKTSAIYEAFHVVCHDTDKHNIVKKKQPPFAFCITNQRVLIWTQNTQWMPYWQIEFCFVGNAA